MPKLTLTLLGIIAIISFSFGQIQEATTKSGKKVLLNSDGTWKYAEEKKVNNPPQKISFSKEEDNKPNEVSIDVNSADCSKYVSIEEDKFTGKTSIAGKGFIIIPSKSNSKEGLKILNVIVGEEKDALVCNITAIGGINCVDKGDMVYFICADGTKFNLSHSSDFNCKGDFTLYLGGVFGNNQELGYLSTKKISAIRVQTKNNIQEVDLNNDESMRLVNEISCLLKYKK